MMGPLGPAGSAQTRCQFSNRPTLSSHCSCSSEYPSSLGAITENPLCFQGIKIWLLQPGRGGPLWVGNTPPALRRGDLRVCQTPAVCSFWPPWPRVAGPTYFIQVSWQNCISTKHFFLHPTCAVLALRGFQPLRSNDLVKWLEGGFQALGMVYVVCYWVLGRIVRRLLEGG